MKLSERFHIYRPNEGSLVVDAAFSVPVFIIAMVLILSLCMQAGTEETVNTAMAKAALNTVSLMAAEGNAEGDEDRSVKTGLVFSADLLAILAGELRYDNELVLPAGFHADIGESLLGGNLNIDHICRADVVIYSSVPVPDIIKNSFSQERSLYFRLFSGESQRSGIYDSVRVYVFPKRGEKYHSASCYILKEGSVETILTSSLRKSYSACGLCHPETLENGSNVYMFSDLSVTYHRKECASITKSYISMARSEAIHLGYLPCQICGGGL